MLDAHEHLPSNPISISTFPAPSDADYKAVSGHFGPHNIHENRAETFISSELIFATYQNAGTREKGTGRENVVPGTSF